MLGLKPWIIIAVLLALIGSFVTGLSAGRKLMQGQYAKEEVTQLRVEATVTNAIATALAKQKPINQYRTQVLQREIVHVPDYTRCVHTDAAFGVLNDALENKPVAVPADNSIVPEADKADGEHVRSDDHEAP